MPFAVTGILAVIVLLVVRSYHVLTQSQKPFQRNRSQPCSLAVFLGSGGHTSEALTLVSALDFERYRPRTYIFSEGDTLSAQKAEDLEASKSSGRATPSHRLTDSEYILIAIPRARRVHQSLLSTPPTALLSLASCIYHITIRPVISLRLSGPPFADVLVLNGPGTCFTLCVATYLNRFLGLPSPRLIYVESFARVRSLSLSGKLLRPFVDRFIVQWPELLKEGRRGECRGWLV